MYGTKSLPPEIAQIPLPLSEKSHQPQLSFEVLNSAASGHEGSRSQLFSDIRFPVSWQCKQWGTLPSDNHSFSSFLCWCVDRPEMQLPVHPSLLLNYVSRENLLVSEAFISSSVKKIMMQALCFGDAFQDLAKTNEATGCQGPVSAHDSHSTSQGAPHE